MMIGKVIKNRFHSYTKPCKRCDKLFNPTSRCNKICDQCKETSYQWRKKKGGKKTW